MMFKRVLLSASAAMLLILPTVGFAADNQGKDQRPGDQGNGRQAQPQEQGRPQQGRPQQQDQPQRQGGPQQQTNPQRQGRLQQQAQPQQQGGPQQQTNPQRQGRLQQQAQPQQQGGPQQQINPQRQGRPQQQATLQQRGRPQQQAGQIGAVGTRHVQQSNQWRSSHANWTSGTVWQRNPNWWRGNAAFRNYTGTRVNFFYAPGYGYYSVPQEYWGRSWNAGAYLPLFFLRYAVSDYQDYGLPPPPYGCSWVWVNTDVLLVDRSDGYILDEVDNVW